VKEDEMQTSELTVRPGSGQFFDAIAPRYDLLNRILSMGIDQGWRRRTVRSLGLRPGMRVLDLATGTADLAIQIARSCEGVEVVGVDPSRGMLELGRKKVDALGLADRITLLEGDAEKLALESGSFDAITIAFGIRNVPDRAKGLAEMARVGKPGARIAILELGEPRSGLLGPMARFHIRVMVPTIGALLSGAKEYRYLQSSIAAFPEPERFVELMASSGIEDARAEALTFGVCHLYLGRSPGAAP
jgi:demethylmenaquinone methyltransferase/2-methoxy-6-polyprenyl-1,4-benzoquinol methylase